MSRVVRKTRDELKDFQLTPAQRARLDAMTDEEITAAALSDPDNPPITAAEFRRMRRP
jgi:putative transcriptional regulator